MPTDWGLSNTGEITISNPPDTLFIGIRMKSTGELHQQLLIDNFNVTGNVTGISTTKASLNNLEIYPNPITNKSVISFQTKTSGKVNLSIFDIQGRKICTLIDEKINTGMHTVPISNSLLEDGVYFCKLQTSEGISTEKIIVNSK